MIPTIANIRKAIYCLNKRIDQLDNQIKDMLGLDSSSIQSLINILNDKDASTGILNTLLQKADKTEIPTVPGNESAVSGGTTLSVVTTGEKYDWNSKANIWRGTQAEYDLINTPDDNTIYIITPDLP